MGAAILLRDSVPVIRMELRLIPLVREVHRNSKSKNASPELHFRFLSQQASGYTKRSVRVKKVLILKGKAPPAQQEAKIDDGIRIGSA